MTGMEDLAARVAALEERIGQEAGLRASVDRDVASVEQTLRAQHHTIQALAITVAEHNHKIDRLDDRIRAVDAKVDQIGAGVRQIIDMLGDHE